MKDQQNESLSHFMRISRLMYALSYILSFVRVAAIAAGRATFIWLAAMLVEPAVLGLPEITWLRAFGMVVIVRALVSNVIAVRVVTETPSIYPTARNTMDEFKASMDAGLMQKEK